MKTTPFIFWMASWYPTKLDPFPGDFIQRHAKALALYHPVHVLHIAKDEDGVVTKDVLIEENIEGNLHETIIYYYPFKTGISFIDRLISIRTFLRIGKKFIAQKLTVKQNIFIHVHVAMRHGLLAHWAKQKLGIKYVITEHWTGYDRKTYPENLRPAKWFWLATKKIFKEASFFYPEVKKVGELINKTITPIAYKPVSNTVDTHLFYHDKTKADALQTFNCIHVSTLSYQKNIEGILNVIEKIAAHKSNIHFTIVGPASEALIDRVAASPMLSKAITLTGALPYDLVAAQMRKAHALLMFSRYENQPCVIVEALCCGLPVITTNVGGIAEVINNSNGILLDSGDENALYNAIQTMVTSYQSYNAESIAAAAQQAYSYETIGKEILANYEQDLSEFF